MVVANDWPLLQDLEIVRHECAPLAQRIVNSVRSLGGTNADSILTFLSARPAESVVVASSDFEFS
ncbi:hypothetical protein AAHH78_39545, partial [Burkholderia pseudomallei]